MFLLRQSILLFIHLIFFFDGVGKGCGLLFVTCGHVVVCTPYTKQGIGDSSTLKLPFLLMFYSTVY